MRVKLSIIYALFLLLASGLKAQDVHFSHPDISPLLYNPATCGFYDDGAGVALTGRSQWWTVSHPYQTYALAADANLWHDREGGSGIGAGLVVLRDKAGTLNYGLSSVQVMLSYRRCFGGYLRHCLAFAVQVGGNQLGYDVGSASLYDATEQLPRGRQIYPAFGLGLAWRGQLSDFVACQAGTALHNINSPVVSFFGSDEVRVWRRYVLYGRFDWRFADAFSLRPVLLYEHQHNNNELLYGTDVCWHLNEYLDLQAGAALRQLDALVFDVSVFYNSFCFAFCYDANVSRLSAASGGVGAVELAVCYRFDYGGGVRTAPDERRKALPCPIM